MICRSGIWHMHSMVPVMCQVPASWSGSWGASSSNSWTLLDPTMKKVIVIYNLQRSSALTAIKCCSFLSRIFAPGYSDINSYSWKVNIFTFIPARGKILPRHYCLYYSKKRKLSSYLYCDDDSLVGPKRLLGSHFNCSSPDCGPRHQKAFLINVHYGNFLGPIQDTVAQRRCAIPLENKAKLFFTQKWGPGRKAQCYLHCAHMGACLFSHPQGTQLGKPKVPRKAFLLPLPRPTRTHLAGQWGGKDHEGWFSFIMGHLL